MKKIAFLFFGITLLFAACKSDRDLETTLRYDGSNDNAPLLQPDTYEAAARFPASVTADYVGKQITQVSFYMATTPLQTKVKIYSGGTSDAPGDLVYEEDVTGNVTQNSFNALVLANPIDITGEDLWIAIGFRLNRGLQTIGCDAGPGVDDGDWLFQESDGLWTPFINRTNNAVDINWNIRAVVSE